MSKTHKEHVALMKCFYCGGNGDIEPVQDLSELNGKADPRYPCRECEDKMKQGVMICEVRDDESGGEPYRTGRAWVMKQEATERIFSGSGYDFNKIRFFFLEEKTAKIIGLHNAPQ